MTVAAEITTDGGVDPDPHPYRMKDLCELTGLGRQAIHFYIQRGLLPPGKKTGRNMAWYGQDHLERLQLIKRLQHERFLPLKAIKAILDDQQNVFSTTQRGFLLGVKQHLQTRIDGAPGQVVDADELAARLELAPDVLPRLVELELIGLRRDESGQTWVAQDDVWLVEAWAELQAVANASQITVSPDDLRLYDEAMSQLFQREAQLVASRIAGLPEDRAADVIEQILPIIHSILTGMHHSKIRNFLASIG